MADINNSGSPWAVALQLAISIARTEGKALGTDNGGSDRAYALRLYKECLEVVGNLGVPK